MSVWINDTLIINDKATQNGFDEEYIEMNLEAGKKYKLKLEYHNNIQNKATVSLYWSSNHQYKQVIPASQLFTNNQ